MPSYGFCMLDPGGVTQDYFVRSFVNDDAARESADRLVSRSCGVEIWDGRRLVARIPARADAPAGTWAAWRARHLAVPAPG
ncbi:MAG TPA: hypothetical protein VGG99_27285 [Acetobacteraceae bacterium]|jgi:hypothetical protein